MLTRLALTGADQQINQALRLSSIGALSGHGRRIHRREGVSRRQGSGQDHARSADDLGRLRAADRPQRIAFSKAAHRGGAMRKDFEAIAHTVGNA